MVTLEKAAHRQTRYEAAPTIDPPAVLPLPPLTDDIEQAKRDITHFGMCLLTNVLTDPEVDAISAKLERQAAAERTLGARAPTSPSFRLRQSRS